MPAKIHAHLLSVAKSLSEDLYTSIKRVGPMALADRSGVDFPYYLARAVAGQQLSVKAAQSIWARVEACNTGLDFAEAFSTPRQAELRQCGLSGAKIKTLNAISHAHKDGWLCGDQLRLVSAQKRAEHLCELWGIGQWTADMANIFWFGEQDVWPDGDVTARKTLERLTSKRRKTTRTAQRFSPYRSHLAFAMWRVADARVDT